MKRLLYCDLMFFYTSVFCAGIQNIVTQMFFDTRYPAQKELLLPIALLLASLSTIGGIYASSGRFSTPPPIVILLFLTATIGAFCGLFYVENPVLYILLFCVASFCINFVYNVFDPFLGHIAKGELGTRHIKVLLSYQMLGYTLAPVFFSLTVSKRIICIPVILCLGILSYAGVLSAYRREHLPGMREGQTAHRKTGSADAADKAILTFCFVMFTVFYLFISSAAYFFKDFLRYDNYSLVSSLFLGGVVLFSAVAVTLFSGEKLLRLIALSPALLLLGLVLLCLNSGHYTILMVIVTAITGLSYGSFLTAGKTYVNQADPQKGLIGQYNKVMTVASLSAFMLSALIGWLGMQFSFSVIKMKIGAVMVLLLLSLICAIRKG